jgi:Flp pilus assembly protein TadG
MNIPPKFGRRDDHGVVAIELVLVAPFLLALIFAIASFGLWFSKEVQVTGDARDVARALALRDPNWNNASKRPSGASIQSFTPCAAGDTTNNASVTLTYNGSALISIPGIPLSPPAITSTETMRCGG